MPAAWRCDECLRIVRALRVARQADNHALRARLQDVAAVSGRDLREFGIEWVFSIARMPDEEMQVVLESHYPTLSEAMRRREAHEKTTGHRLDGWQTLLHYMPDAPD